MPKYRGDWSWVRQPCGLQQDVIEPPPLFHELFDGRRARIFDGATQTSVGHLEELFGQLRCVVRRVAHVDFATFSPPGTGGGASQAKPKSESLSIPDQKRKGTFNICGVAELVHDHSYSVPMSFRKNVPLRVNPKRVRKSVPSRRRHEPRTHWRRVDFPAPCEAREVEQFQTCCVLKEEL